MSRPEPRRTARIPDSQRKRKPVRLTLGPQAHEVLEALPPRTASEYVEELILDDRDREQRLLDSRGR